MAIILNLETATTNCSVSISRDGEVAFLREVAEQGYSHAENLHRFIREGLEELGLAYADLDAVAVSMGPGSYTGLRIGVSAAKGLCFALEIPLIALPTLDVLNRQFTQEDGQTVAMLDARRMEVYSAIYDTQGVQVRATEAEVIDADSFAEELEHGKLYFIGNATEKCSTVIDHPNAVFATGIDLPSAKEMAPLAKAYYREGKFEDVAYFEPYYLKDFMVTKKKK